MPSRAITYSAISILPNFIRLPGLSYPNLDKYCTIYTYITAHVVHGPIFLYVHANELTRVVIIMGEILSDQNEPFPFRLV